MHLGMSGSFRIDRGSKRLTSNAEATSGRHDHVVFTLSNGVTVTFNDPRRFGVMDVLDDVLPAPTGARDDGAGAARGLFRRGGDCASVDRQANGMKVPCSIYMLSRVLATSTRAKRCTAPGCRLCADRRPCDRGDTPIRGASGWLQR